MSTRLRYVVAASAAAAAPLSMAAVCSGAPVVFPAGQGGNGNAYEVVLDAGISANDARGAAALRGGHLVTITSAAEQSFVEALLDGADAPTGSYWMDLQRAGTGFAWGTGEGFDYSNFAAGEPNDFLGREDFGQVYWAANAQEDLVARRGRWNDAAAAGYPNPDNESFPTPDLSRAGFIVEREATAVPLPAAVFAAPLAALLAAGAGRRMRRAK
jgi:hypothetical protein